jgi:hypothetical protein
MTGNFVSDVSGREDAPAEVGSALQKSWTILLERKVKSALVAHKSMVKVERVQQPINGQWLIVVNGTIVIHRPGKTVTSIFRADNDVSAETIRESCFTNLIDADKPSARVKNETQLFAMLIAEVDKDNGIDVEPKEEPANSRKAAFLDKVATDDKTNPVAAFLDKMSGDEKPSGLKRRGKDPMAGKRPAVAETESEEADDSLDAVKTKESKPFPPLLKYIDGLKQFKRLDCLLVEAVNTQGQYVEWAVNVYVPISELVDNQLEVVEQLHLLTIIDEHSRGCAEFDLAESTFAPMAMRLDFDEMSNGSVAETLEKFFDDQRPTASMSSAENGEMAFLQDEIGIPDTSVNIMANMMVPIRRESVKVEQTCKHPSAAVRNALSRFKLKTVYFGRVSPE